MKPHQTLASLLGTTLLLLSQPSIAPAQDTATIPNETPAQHDARMAWFREARFGMFIHWGVYSVPAGEWKDKTGYGEWFLEETHIPVSQYEKFADQFNPVKFDAKAWVKAAKDAGMKYIVITSKHHDGFAMYHSLVSKYNIYDATPFHRDPLKELAAACARHHIRFGFYYSQAQDWHEPNGAGNTWDFGPDDKKDFDQYLRSKAEPQVKELLTNYGPVCLIWFDTPRMMNVGDRAQRFVDILHSLAPATLIDGRLGKEGDYRSMGDNSIPNQVVAGDWEVPATLNHTWGFKKDDTDWKTPEDLTFKLVDIASKGGNYLLNVGPTAEGVIPQASQDNLRAVGRWLKVNGEAVYGAGPTPFGEELGQTDNSTTDKKGNPGFKVATEWRCTTKPGKLYITFFKWPSGTFELNKVKGQVTKAYLLADPSHKALKLKQSGDQVTVTLPDKAPGQIASVLALNTK
jgi:alpha-L-fucosidase